jgi:hypothetical protein
VAVVTIIRLAQSAADDCTGDKGCCREPHSVVLTIAMPWPVKASMTIVV